MEDVLEKNFLGAVGAAGAAGVDTQTFAAEHSVEHQAVVGLMKSLEADGYIVQESVSSESWQLSSEALSYVAKGSPEVQLFNAVPAEGVDDAGLDSLFDKAFVAIAKGKCLKNKWLARDKATGKYSKTAAAVDKDELVEQLQGAASGSLTDAKVLKELKGRTLIELIKRTTYKVTPGPSYAAVRRKIPADLTKEMLESGDWASTTFKEYNLESDGLTVGGGHTHALMKVRAEFRQILLEMGFSEMPTNRWVESSFWNFDSLFQPQSHPSRDMHDTFFMKTPSTTLTVPEEYLTEVKKIHEVGGFGSTGHGYEWKREEAMKNLLRTHTTAISARMLHALANQPGGFKPARYFSIDRVFRNEALDATHLAEFHQVEGVVADYNLSLGDLLGIIAEFFKRIGITQLRFKPAFNPYTEPSMEIFGYHPDLKKWTEIGNSGIFRPEMLLPMGIPSDVRVIAWGLSLERPTMIKYRLKNIRDLFGHKVKLDMSRQAPMCRF